MTMNNNSAENLLQLKKILALITAIGLFVISMWFSQLGFGIESNEKYQWIGWFLSIVVTVIQLVFNTSIQKLNPTLVGAGILSYSYSIYTNVTGLKEIFNGWGFAIIVGLIVDGVAEPLFAWAIGVYDGGDVVGNLGNLLGFRRGRSQQQETQKQPQHSQYKPQYKPTFPPVNRGDESTFKPQNKNKDSHRFGRGG
jgi:hypothetical protein